MMCASLEADANLLSSGYPKVVEPVAGRVGGEVLLFSLCTQNSEWPEISMTLTHYFCNGNFV